MPSKKASEEVVPGMAEAIEARRMELGLSPGELAARAGVTPEGLMPLRKGFRRSYRDKLKIGVARALGWTTNSIDLLLGGQEPRPTWGGDEPPPAAPAAAAAEQMQIAALAGQMTPEQLARVEAYMRGILGE
jgi:hypothetical protein